MMMTLLRLSSGVGRMLALCVALVSACSSSGSGGGAACVDGGVCTTGGTGGAGTGGGSATGGAAGFGGGGALPGVCAGGVIPENVEFCATSKPPIGPCASPPACLVNRPVEVCCVSVRYPGKDGFELERTTNLKRHSDPNGGPVDLGCFEPSGYPPKPNPGGTVTLLGSLRAAANGGCTPQDFLGVTIEVFTVVRTGDPATDGTLGPLVGAPVVVDGSQPVVEEPVDNKCIDDKRYNVGYAYPGVPLDTELVIRTAGDGFAPVYTYNVYASTSDPAYDAPSGSFTEDLLVLAGDDFTTWPTAGIGKTIAEGRALVFGEVRDCSNIRVQHATVDVSADRGGLSYADGNEDNPLPNSSTLGTLGIGMFEVFDVPASPGTGEFVRVSAAGVAPGPTLASVGYFDARAFPNSATYVVLRGLRPFQVP